MLKNILGKKENLESSTDVVLKMNLTEMKSYIKNEKINEDGLIAVMNRLVKLDKTSQKYYVQPDDMDSKIRKAFELVLEVSKNKKITVVAVELMQEFTVIYDDIIKKYDKDNKDIYSARFKKAISNAVVSVNRMAHIAQKMHTTK